MVVRSEEDTIELKTPYVVNPFLGQRVADAILDQFNPLAGGFRVLLDLTTLDTNSRDSRLYMLLTLPACPSIDLVYKMQFDPNRSRYVNLSNQQGAGVRGISLRDLVTWKEVQFDEGTSDKFAITEIVVLVPGGVLVTEEEMARVQREGGVKFRREE